MPLARGTKDRTTKETRVLANRYEVIKKIGSGHFGTVFLCKDTKCNNAFKVLKEIPVGDLQPDETVDAMREARLLSKLDHPGIVKFYDSFIDGEYFCIITEYCEGGDLAHKIEEYKKQGKLFDEDTILNWTIQLLLAVQYIHSHRVLHRDLKTRNIFICNNLLKIGDFGISRILMNTTDLASTFVGTPYYMSPEVVKYEGYNSKSDIWSLGCILFEMCSQEHLFKAQNLVVLMHDIVEKETPDLPDRYSKILNEVFIKMLTKDPEKRPSALEVTKIPFIEKHMTKMKDTLTKEYITKHNMNPELVGKQSTELASLLKSIQTESVRQNQISAQKGEIDDGQSVYSTSKTDDTIDNAHNTGADEELTLTEESLYRDEDDFVKCLEQALENKSGESTMVSDDSVSGAFGPGAKETKIKHMRIECINTLGEDVFNKAYNYLKSARNTKKHGEKSEKEIMEGLRKCVINPSDCFLVDQLLFLEEQ